MSTATPGAPEHGSHDWIMAEAERIVARGESAPRWGRDPVNQPMVNNWVEAMGDRNPMYVDAAAAEASVHGGLVAPPAMVQVWTMGGLGTPRDPDEPLYATMAMLDEAGYPSVVATDSEQEYLRYLKAGEEVSLTSRLRSVVGPKRTGLGEGYFVTTENIWRVGDEIVATMTWRILKFKPQAPQVVEEDVARHVIRPVVNRDSEFFWEGTRKGELRVQTCGSCGELRHPPGPMCPLCGATDRDYVVARGTGTVHSYVVHRHPPVPGKELPIVIALVELDEGVRMVGELIEVDDDQVEIGMPVAVRLLHVDDELTLPAWRPVTGADR
jgi:uncharacterized OB-fold protein